jgi:hypothetical protein
MRWAKSAFKHGIATERSRYVVEHAFGVFDVPAADDPATDRLLFLGNDASGVPLEVVAIEVQLANDTWELLIIHAMRLRVTYRELYEAAIRSAMEGRNHD